MLEILNTLNSWGASIIKGIVFLMFFILAYLPAILVLALALVIICLLIEGIEKWRKHD
jgi:hypothetical protein